MGSCGITAGLGHFGVAKVALRGLFGVSGGENEVLAENILHHSKDTLRTR